MFGIIRWLEQWWCRRPRHSQVRRAYPGKLSLECMDCGKCSKGVQIGTHIGGAGREVRSEF